MCSLANHIMEVHTYKVNKKIVSIKRKKKDKGNFKNQYPNIFCNMTDRLTDQVDTLWYDVYSTIS